MGVSIGKGQSSGHEELIGFSLLQVASDEKAPFDGLVHEKFTSLSRHDIEAPLKLAMDEPLRGLPDERYLRVMR